MRIEQSAETGPMVPEAEPPATEVLVARERIRRVFRYLQALNEHRNPVRRDIREYRWLQWLHELPVHAALEVARMEDAELADGEAEESRAEGFVLKVRRPTLTPPPSPPELLVDWLEKGWKEPSGPLRVRATLEVGARTEEFDNDR